MKIVKYISPLYRDYVWNYIISNIPILFIREFFLKYVCRVKLGKHSIVDMKVFFIAPAKLVVGEFSHINRNCTIDARGGITIMDNVSISLNVTLCSAGHDCQSSDFKYVSSPITIEDNVWIGINTTILKGVTIGKGAVVAAGSVVTKDCEPFGIYAGIPARKIGERKTLCNYRCTDFAYYKQRMRKPYFQ